MNRIGASQFFKNRDKIRNKIRNKMKKRVYGADDVWYTLFWCLKKLWKIQDLDLKEENNGVRFG